MEDRIKRDKAFIGAIIKGVGGALLKGFINARKAKKQAQQQQEIANSQIINQNNANINAEMQNTDYINDYDDRGFLSLTTIYENGNPHHRDYLMEDGTWKMREDLLKKVIIL